MPIPPRLRVPQSVLSRTIGTETILFDMQTSSYYGLNEVGGRFWKLVQEEQPIEEILSALIREFEVDRPRLEMDISSLVTELQNLGLLELIEEAA